MKNAHVADLKKQQGFTALEVTVVLIIGLLIIALAASHFTQLFGKSNDSEELGNIETLMGNTKALKTASGYGASGTSLVSQLIAAGGIPSNMTVIASVPYNDWNGAVTVVSTGNGFTIGYVAVPQSDCIALATKVSKGGEFASTQVNAAATVTGVYTSAQATTDCSSANANTITWTSAS
jgi:prepilin-type N-terminal cleavage/methylation domain-containing protein